MKTLVRPARRGRISKNKNRSFAFSKPSMGQELVTPEGSSAQVRGPEIVLHAADGTVVATWDGRQLVVGPSVGDLVLRAPRGTVSIRGQNVEVSSDEVTKVAGETFAIESRNVRWAVETMALVASKMVEVSAPALEQTYGRVRTDAGRLVERAGSVFRDVEDVVETHAGRIRTMVRGATHWFSRATTVVSEEDTFIDGKRVLLG